MVTVSVATRREVEEVDALAAMNTNTVCSHLSSHLDNVLLQRILGLDIFTTLAIF